MNAQAYNSLHDAFIRQVGRLSGWRLSRNRFLVVLLLVLSGLAQAQGVALGQAQCPIGWHPIPAADGNAFVEFQENGTSGGHTMRVIPLRNPISGAAPPSCSYTGGSIFYPTSQQCTPGSCMLMTPNCALLGQDAAGNPMQTNGLYPNGVFGDGYFAWQMTNASTNPATIYTMNMWSLGGKWTNYAPPPPNDPGPPPVVGAATGSALGEIDLTVAFADGTPASWLATYFYGPTLSAQRTDAAGMTRLRSAVQGPYQIHLTGNVSDAGNNASLDYMYNCTLSGGQTLSVVITLNPNGTVKNATTSTNTSTNPADPNAAPTWLQSAFTALIIPSAPHWNPILADLNALKSWGPFGVFSQMIGITSITAVDSSNIITLTIPVPVVQYVDIHTHFPTFNMNLDNRPLSFQPIITASGWPFVRLMMGASVWMTFIFGLAHKFMPRFYV